MTSNNAFYDISSSYRARVAYSQLSKTLGWVESEVARDRILEAMDAIWNEMPEQDRNAFRPSAEKAK